MSLLVLLATAGSLGLLGGLHCVAMCGALQRFVVHGAGGIPPPAASGGGGGGGTTLARVIALQPAGTSRGRAIVIGADAGLGADLVFHTARLLGYAALGAAVGSGSWLLRWGADAMPSMRPLWGSMNALMLALGLALLVLGRQPAWIDALGQRVWAATGSRLDRRRTGRPVAAGFAWALVPCGLLYSALATAALASDPLRGAAAMLAFGAGTAVNLLAAQWLIGLIGRHSAARAVSVESIGVRIGGALLAGMAAAALVALALGQPHPFCAT
jgi:sulfite exporter TauE/SafE